MPGRDLYGTLHEGRAANEAGFAQGALHSFANQSIVNPPWLLGCVAPFVLSSLQNLRELWLNVSKQRTEAVIAAPTRLHEHPAIVFKVGKPLWSNTTTHCRPKVVFTSTLFKRQRETHCSSADVPEQNSECIDIHAVVIATWEQLWSHVDGRAYDGTWHHGLGFTEAQISDLASVLWVKLEETTTTTTTTTTTLLGKWSEPRGISILSMAVRVVFRKTVTDVSTTWAVVIFRVKWRVVVRWWYLCIYIFLKTTLTQRIMLNI